MLIPVRQAEESKRTRQLSGRDERHIEQIALRSKKTTDEVRRELELSVTTRLVKKEVGQTPYLKYKQCRPAPDLQAHRRFFRV